jgi:cyclophilin family peptidyl-prolyl cis-trans isomerase
VLKDANFLDGQYNTVLGRLTAGMDAIDKTAALGRETRWMHQSVYPEQARMVKVALSD